MSSKTTNKREHITIGTKVGTKNGVDKQEKSILTFKIISQNQRHLPFIKTPHSSLFPITGITTTLVYNDTLRKERELSMSLLPSSTV